MRYILALQLIAILLTSSCAGMGDSGSSHPNGNENGSNPINPTEDRNYKRAISKCYKTGGSRVVKIEGQLMCY